MIDTNPLDRILGILGTKDEVEAQTKLEEKFSYEEMDRALNQWSVLCAWSWLEPNEYPQNKKPSADEENLRHAFIDAIKKSAMTLTKERYAPGDWIGDIKRASYEISEILNGEKPEKCKIKLPDLYEKITGKKDYFFTEEHTKSFLWVISVERFTGLCAGYLPEKDMIVHLLAYPPRPTPSTLSTKELVDWSGQKNADGEYYPPTPYIPTCNC